jgi:hypothetical protein
VFSLNGYPGLAVLQWGNGCGHTVDEPRPYVEPPHLSDRPFPAIIGKIMDRIREYYDKPSILPTLNAANGSDRQQRSERREACVSLFCAMVQYLDLITLRCGRPTEAAGDAFSGITLPKLARLAGLTQRRAERACRDLVRAGLVKVHRIAHAAGDAEWVGLAAIRSIPAKVFDALGIGLAVKREREKASKRRRERKPAEHDPAKARASLAIDVAREQLTAKPKPQETGIAGLRGALRRSDRPPG